MKTGRLLALVVSMAMAHAAYGQQGRVTVTLTVFRIDDQGERPAKNAWVGVFPKGPGVGSKYTNGRGEVTFSFPEAESVYFRVGTNTNNRRTPAISGRLSQHTSYLDDRRENSPVNYCSGSDGDEINTIQDMLDDLKYQAGGRLMDGQSREFLESLTPLIGGLPIDDEQKATLFAEQQALLQPRWWMDMGTDRESGGWVVQELDPNGPASLAGLQVGDLITQFEGQDLATAPLSLRWMIANSESQTVTLTVRKPDGQEQQLTVTMRQ